MHAVLAFRARVQIVVVPGSGSPRTGRFLNRCFISYGGVVEGQEKSTIRSEPKAAGTCPGDVQEIASASVGDFR